MKFVLKKLKGNLTLDEAIDARVLKIQAIGQRSSSYVLKTVQENGFTQTELYPKKRREAPMSAAGAIAAD